MRTEVDTNHQSASDTGGQDANACPNCRALMPNDMRFCRACGCRLGEGVEEYTETVRFQGATGLRSAKKSRTASRGSSSTSQKGVKEWGAMARNASGQAAKSMTAGLDKWKIGRACKRVPPWMMWIIIPIFVASMIGGPISISRNRRDRGGASASAQSSYIGSNYKTVQGGAFIEQINPPGSAADLAGLVGGDVISSVDGKPVKSKSDLDNLLSGTPVGKTVEVIFIRDGETRTTRLVTVSEAENDRLAEAFDDTTKGFLGTDGVFKRVQVPDTNIYGVELNKVNKNRPGYIAGLRNNDIVIEFGGVPIRTAEEFDARIDRAIPDSTVMVVVMRAGVRLEIPVKMGEN